jgi:trimethylamine--corrinoid protein Co-methyltransferase
MLKGILRALDSQQMETLHCGALRVLEQTGLQIQGNFLLTALADAGCKVDFAARRAWFRPELVERQIAAQRGRYKLVRSSLWYPFCRRLPDDDVAIPDEFLVDYGYTTPWLYDYPEGRYRKPTIQDQIDMIRLGNALPCVKAVSSPLICSEFDPRVEPIESARLLLHNTRKPGWTGTHCGKQVKYLAEMAALAVGGDQQRLRSEPPLFVAAYCTTSPLKLDTRSCDVLEHALPYGFPVNFAPMPILGATAPITPAGAAVVALAEILGCLTAASLINPDVYYFSTSIAGEMDMRTTQVCYCTPGAILTDVALHQIFRYRYGLVHNIEPGYVEAKTPGIQAAFMKTYRQMAFGCTASLPLPIGGLDNGAVFSPTQAMIDLEMNEPIYKLARGIEVDEDACALDLIHEMLFCQSRTYLETEHTAHRYRGLGWYPRLFDRTYCDHTQPAPADDENLLRQADAAWRRLVAAQEPIEVDAAFAAELDRIVEAARKELLTD